MRKSQSCPTIASAKEKGHEVITKVSLLQLTTWSSAQAKCSPHFSARSKLARISASKINNKPPHLTLILALPMSTSWKVCKYSWWRRRSWTISKRLKPKISITSLFWKPFWCHSSSYERGSSKSRLTLISATFSSLSPVLHLMISAKFRQAPESSSPLPFKRRKVSKELTWCLSAELTWQSKSCSRTFLSHTFRTISAPVYSRRKSLRYKSTNFSLSIVAPSLAWSLMAQRLKWTQVCPRACELSVSRPFGLPKKRLIWRVGTASKPWSWSNRKCWSLTSLVAQCAILKREKPSRSLATSFSSMNVSRARASSMRHLQSR